MAASLIKCSIVYEPDKLITCRLHVLDASVKSVRMQINVCSDEDEVAIDELTTGDDDDDDNDEDESESDVAF